MRYLIKIAYDGSKFNGFQRLKNNNSVQGIIESALKKISKKEVFIKGAGRTDRGVHAYAQMAHFDLELIIPPDNLRRALNSLVGDYIYIKDCKIVEESFHARFSVLEKTYEYRINLGEYDPLKREYYLQLSEKLNIKKMKKLAKIFLGVHDFENFVSGQRDDYTAIIYDISFSYKKDILCIRFKGKSFYRYMVRNLVGALIDVGIGKKNINQVKKSLNKKSNQRFSVAYPQGLYLIDIKY